MKEEETKKKKTTTKKTTSKKTEKKVEPKEEKKVTKKATTKKEKPLEVEKVKKPRKVTKKKEPVDVTSVVEEEKIEEVKAEPEVVEEVKVEETKVEVPTVEEKTAPVGIVTEEIKQVDLDDTIAAEPVALENLGRSQFDGRLLQLIGWWLVGLILSTITLGLGAPFAKCFILDWRFRHTKINGKRLCFDGNGLQLWGNIIKWTFFTIITLGIFLLFLPVQWNRWIVKHTHYEGNRKPKVNYSVFDGITWEFIGISILSGLLTFFSLGLLKPFCDNLMYSWRINHTTYDTIDMEFDGKGFQLLGNYIKWTFFTIITLGIYGLWVPIKKIKWEVKHTNEKGFSKHPYRPILGMLLPILFAIACLSGEIYGLTRIDKDKWIDIRDGINEYVNDIIDETKKYDFGHVMFERIADVYYMINTKDCKITWDERYERYFNYNKVDKYTGNYYSYGEKMLHMAVVNVKTSKDPVLITYDNNRFRVYWLNGNRIENHFYMKGSTDLVNVTDKKGDTRIGFVYRTGGVKLDYLEDVVNYSENYVVYGIDEEEFNKEVEAKGLKITPLEMVFKPVTLNVLSDYKKVFGTYVEPDKKEDNINIDIPEPQIKLNGFRDYYMKYVEDNIKDDTKITVVQFASLEDPVMVIPGKKETTVLSFVNNELITNTLPAGEVGTIKKANKSTGEVVLITSSGKNQLYYFVEGVVDKNFTGDKMLKVKKSKAAKGLKALGYTETKGELNTIKASKYNLGDLEKALDTKGEVIEEEEIIPKLHVGDYILEYGDYKNESGAVLSIMSNGSYSYVATEGKKTIRETGEYKVQSNSICTDSTTKGSNVSSKCWIVNDDNKFTDAVDNNWTLVK